MQRIEGEFILCTHEHVRVSRYVCLFVFLLSQIHTQLFCNAFFVLFCINCFQLRRNQVVHYQLAENMQHKIHQ